LHRQVAPRDAGEPTDRDLLHRFACGRDGDAFAALVRRHGPLVLGVCRRVLRNEADAEDAFQATFLVLARRAGSIGQPERLGNWLYGVASRVAQKARAEAARRRTRQEPVTDMPARRDDRGPDWEDLREVLDDEVRRLPDKFCAPLVLCYLEGMTREEAAARLGRSAGAVKGLLERGRELLRSRLARRGVTLSSGALAAMLSGNALAAAVPAVLRDSTARAALAFAAGEAPATGSAAALAEGVLQAMMTYRVKWWLAAALMLGLASGGAGLLAFGGRPAEERAAQKQGPIKADEQADARKRLAAARLDTAKTAYGAYWALYEAGRSPEEVVHLWSRRWLQSQLDLSDKKADRDAALAAYQERLQKADAIARARLVLGNSPVFGRDHEGPEPAAPEKPKTQREKFETLWKAYQEGRASEEQVCLASIRWLIDQNLLRRIDERIDPKAELQAHLGRIKKVEEIAKVRFDAGRTALPDYKTATFFRLQAEEWLAEGKTFEEKDLGPGAPSK
jgi:RNA polymerase sigma factor (sigma-70 family)